MKSRIYLFAIILLSLFNVIAQSPEGFNYQAVIRNNAGEVLSNTSVGIRMSLIQGSANGQLVYRETFTKATNSFGLIDLVIGKGSATTGSFSTIDWAAGPYFLETAIDQNGGSNYAVLGTSQLMSVPFAMYAASSASDGQDGADGQDGKSAYEIWLEAGNSGSEEDFLASLVGEGSSPQDIALNGTELSITEGSTVDLSGIDTDTNTQLTEAEVDEFVSNNGYLTTETQDLTLSGSDLSITGGSTVDLSTLTNFTDTNTQLSEEEVDAFVANNGYLTTEVDGDVTNEIQDLSLNGTELSITEGSTIDLSGIDTDTNTQLTEAEVDEFVSNNGYLTTETQDLMLSGSDLSITGGSTIDLSTLTNFTDTNTQLSEAEVDAFVSNNGYLTSFTEVDGDATNELQDISLVGTDLSISDGSNVDLSGIDTNTQLSESEVDAFVANNGYLTSFTEVDGDVTNELQTLSVAENGELLTISGGNTVILSGLKEDITNELITTVALNGTDLEITDAGGTITTDLSSVVNDADADPANELNTTIVLNGTNLETTDAGGTISTDLLPLLDAETDPVFAASDVSDVTAADIASWDEAATWGNHADQNYLTNETQNLSDVLTVNNDAGGEPITNLGEPTGPQDAATKAYVDALEATVTTLSDALSTLTTRVDVLEGNWTAAVEAGVDGRELLDEGATVQELVDGGSSVQTLLDANITVKELVDAGKVAADFYGATYQGGFIFDVNEVDGTGSVVAPSNQSNSNWANAITACANLVIDSYDDWFLPSLDELRLVHSNLHVNGYGSFTIANFYWTSTEIDASNASVKGFPMGVENVFPKTNSYSVRAARSFGGEVEQLIIAGETIQDLYDDGFTYGQLYAGGRTIDELEGINPAPSIADLLNAGVSPVALYNNDNSVYSYTNQFVAASYGDLYDAGVSIDELEGINPAPTIADLRIAGVPATELYTNDATTYSYQNLYNEGYTIDNLEDAGADIDDFFAILVPAADLFNYDPTTYSYDNLYSAGYGIDDLEGAGADIDDFYLLGVSASDLFDHDAVIYSYANLHTAGYIIDDLENAGATINDFHSIGVHLLELYQNDPIAYSYANLYACCYELYYIWTEIGSQAILDQNIATLAELVDDIVSGSLQGVIDLNDLITTESVATVTEVYTALGGDPATDLQIMLDQNVPLSAIFDDGFNKVLVWSNTLATIGDIYAYYGGMPANLENLVTDDGFHLLDFENDGFYPNTINDLNTIRDNAPSATAYTFLMGSATGQNLLDLTSPYTVREIYVAEDLIDDGSNNNSVAITTLYGLIIPIEGTVFYTDDFFVTTYIVSDDLGSFSWGCTSSQVTGTGDLIGDGANNTALTLASGQCANYPAAEACNTYDGSSGWFLPSEGELSAIYLANLGITGTHWSSSDGSGAGHSATTVNLSDGSINDNSTPKVDSHNVRAVKVISENP